jgi:hypothetical protein
MKLTADRAALSVLALALALGISTASAQEIQLGNPAPDKSRDQATQAVPENPPQPQKEDIVVHSGIATTARIADPNERVVFSGHVMRMADFVAAVSSSSEAVQRLHNQEKRNREKDPLTRPPQPSHSK